MLLKAFIPGDIVSLKSGGQQMTVVSFGKKKTLCVWMPEGSKKPSKEKFTNELLNLIESEES
jgi:uncharacterized protein YodC (DUF2158 family)